MFRTEEELENYLFEQLAFYEIKAVKGLARVSKGYPDRVVFNHLARQIHYIELKNKTNYTQTLRQKVWQIRIEKSGGIYFLLDGEQQVNDYLETYVHRLARLKGENNNGK